MKILLQNRQSNVLARFEAFGLPVLAVCDCQACRHGSRAGRLQNNLIKMTVKFKVLQYIGGTQDNFMGYGVFVDIDSGGSWLSPVYVTTAFPTSADSDRVGTIAKIYADIVAQAITRGYSSFVTADIQDLAGGLINSVAPASYQTVITQSGTTAPAVSGGLVPSNSYAAGTTFTWARTGAGVYTLTASAAVFNTSGKTGVFIQPLTNLNGAFSVVVTSSTVITITTAVQSLAVLGLLGFTATPTDALLNKTMICVQTYA